MTHKLLYLFLPCVLFLANCTKSEQEFYNGQGKKPVYLPVSELHDIGNTPPTPIELSGTLFLRDTLLFIMEQRKGIHVFNIKDSLNTINLAFFKIPAITDFVITGNSLYADSWKDLVVIDISNLHQILVKDRIIDVINPVLYPPLYNGIFECVDESKGAVVDWEDAFLEDVQCVTIN